MLRSALIAVTAIAAVASAQNTTVEPTNNSTYFYGTDGSLEIDPNTVESSLRSAWCLGQTNNCPEVCDGQVSNNVCSADTLEWTCTCSDSSLQPNITNYAAMMPSYICQQWKELCVGAHPDERDPQQACQSIECGTQNASASSTSSSSSSSSAPASMSATASSTSGSSASETSAAASSTASDTNTGAAAALNVAQAYGSSILAAGLLGVFGLAL